MESEWGKIKKVSNLLKYTVKDLFHNYRKFYSTLTVYSQKFIIWKHLQTSQNSEFPVKAFDFKKQL